MPSRARSYRAVINASACGVLETAREHSDEIGKVYAGPNGIIGVLTEDLIDTSAEFEDAIAALKTHARRHSSLAKPLLPERGLCATDCFSDTVCIVVRVPHSLR